MAQQNVTLQQMLRQHPRRACRGIITPGLIIVCVFFALMIALGAIPGKAAELSAVIPEKLLHFAAYACLSGFMYGGLTGGRKVRALRTLGLTALLGGIDETIQSFMPYRSADMADWGFDMLAVLSSVLLLHFYAAVKAAKEK